MGLENHPYRTEHSEAWRCRSGPSRHPPNNSSDPGCDSCHPCSTELGATVTTGLGQVGRGGANMLKGKAVNVPISGVGHLSGLWAFPAVSSRDIAVPMAPGYASPCFPSLPRGIKTQEVPLKQPRFWDLQAIS